MIDEGKTLILKEMGRGRVKITLFGNDGVLPGFSWAESTGEAPRDISLFRGKTIGGRRSIIRIMKYFGVASEDFGAVFSGSFERDYALVTVTSELRDNLCEIKIRINKTV